MAFRGYTIEYPVRVNINEINQLERTEFLHFPFTTPYKGQIVPWEIKVGKNTFRAEPTLGVYLNCKQTTTWDWSYVASIGIRLLSYNVDQNNPEYPPDPYVFTQTNYDFGAPDLISWNDLIDAKNNYVQNGAIDLRIQIKFGDESRSFLIWEKYDRNCVDGCLTTIPLKIHEIDTLMAVRSPEFEMQGVQWNLAVYKSVNDKIGIHLDQKPDETQDVTCETTLIAKIKSTIAKVKAVEKCKSEDVGPDDILDLAEIISWVDLFTPENGFIENNTLSIEVKIICMKK